MKTYHNQKPNKITPLGGGKYSYCYNAEELEGENKCWQSESVVVSGPLTSNKIIAAVLADAADINQEQKLINEYNAAVLGITPENAEEARNRYADFLKRRHELKAMVESDCAELGIK